MPSRTCMRVDIRTTNKLFHTLALRAAGSFCTRLGCRLQTNFMASTTSTTLMSWNACASMGLVTDSPVHLHL